MKDILYFFKPYIGKKKSIWIGYIALLLESSMTVGVILLQKNILDSVFAKKEYYRFFELMIFYGIFFFGPRLFFTIRKVCFYKVKFELQENMSKAFLEKVYSLSENTLQENGVGKLFAHLKDDVPMACEIFTVSILSDVIKSVLTLILIAILIVQLNPFIFWAVCLVCISYYVLLQLFDKKSKENCKRRKRKKSTTIKTCDRKYFIHERSNCK